MVINSTSGTRLLFIYNLVFFCVFYSCTSENREGSVQITYEDGKAIGVTVPEYLLSKRFSEKDIKVTLKKPGEQPSEILGSFNSDDSIHFKPLVPFTFGKTYVIYEGSEIIAEFTIASEINSTSVSLLNIYPTQDTLPANLLKMHFHFSESMGVEYSTNFVTVNDSKGDSIRSIFLNLNPELWNKERTILTLWLDPGRIKRGLIPNELFGAPLEKGKQYTIIISPGWKSQTNSSMETEVVKTFYVSYRDSLSPQVDHWNLTIPGKNTQNPLVITFNESLDFILIKEAIRIYFEGEVLNTTIQVIQKEKSVQFTPGDVWNAGKYQIRIESRLEDLAGNNLNRLFETDTYQLNQEDTSEFHFLNFEISE